MKYFIRFLLTILVMAAGVGISILLTNLLGNTDSTKALLFITGVLTGLAIIYIWSTMYKTKYKTIKVVWDDTQESLGESGLPTTVNVPEDLPDEDVANYLTQEYGFLVNSWENL